MEIRSRSVNGTTVIDLSGQLVAGPDAAAFQDAVASATGIRVVLNFSQVTRLDCAGISELVRLHCAFTRARRSLIIVRIQPRPARLLALCGLDRVLSSYATEQEAVGRPVNRFLSRPSTTMALVGLY